MTSKCSRRSSCKIKHKLKLGMLELRKCPVFNPGKESKICILYPVVVNSSIKLSVSPKLCLMGPHLMSRRESCISLLSFVRFKVNKVKRNFT